MEARQLRVALLAAVLFVSMVAVSLGARVKTANFIVDTPDPTLARQIAVAAEKYRRDLAVEWLGKAMPNWSQACMITARAGGNLGAGGETKFNFDRGEVYGWRMVIQGPRERLLDSVLPHEILHTIFASHFRQPLPRWADEGAASSVEHYSEQNKHRRHLYNYLRTGRGIAFGRMFAMKQYPKDFMPLYAQGHSLATFLIRKGGRRKYVAFLGDGLNSGDWSAAVQRHYGIAGPAALQETWLAWVKQGSPLDPLPRAVPTESSPGFSPPVSPPSGMLADGRRARPTSNSIYRVPKASASPAPGALAGTLSVDASPVGRQASPVSLPTSGWRAAGSPAAAPPVRIVTPPVLSRPIPTHMTRPQHYQCAPHPYPQFGGT